MYWFAGRQAAVGRVPGLLVGVVEDDELQLGAGERHQALLGGPRGLRPQDLPRALGHRGVLVVEPGQVAHHHRGAGQPRHRVHRVQVEDELHVAVAALPRADGVAVDGVHVDVDGEQVVAPLGAVLEHRVEEELRMDPLALQPSLHVREGDHDGVDVAVRHLHA